MDAADVCEAGPSVTPIHDAGGISSGVRLLVTTIILALRARWLVLQARSPVA